MTNYQIISAIEVVYLFGWALFIFLYTNIDRSNHSVWRDALASVLAGVWPIVLLWMYIHRSGDRLARKFPPVSTGRRSRDDDTE